MLLQFHVSTKHFKIKYLKYNYIGFRVPRWLMAMPIWQHPLAPRAPLATPRPRKPRGIRFVVHKPGRFVLFDFTLIWRP